MNKKPVLLELALASKPTAAASPTTTELAAVTPAMEPTTSPLPETEKATVYLPRAALRRIKQMALDRDCRVNDLLKEGVDMMLNINGEKSLKEFAEA